MSSFESALKWYKEQVSAGKPFSIIQSSTPEFRDGTFTVNRIFQSDPLLLGYFDQRLKLTIDEGLERAASKVAKLHEAVVVRVTPDLHFLREGKLVAVLRSNGFAAADRMLFEDIARELYGIGGSPMRDQPVKDRWSDSLANLLGNKEFVDTLFFVILFLLLPTTMAAYTLVITPSLYVPDLARFGVVFLMLTAAIYIGRLYVRENLKRGKT
ncbi:MAG: hypothetical protein NZ920_02820 [Aigarchaeota archaeon]|nr:hypothetical protein [Aigarchaeota archaeon]MDW8092445.1 hypothetical protein [Nitrososphaerota archaeon]